MAPARAPVERQVERLVEAPIRRGPHGLGRNVIVAPGQSAPSAWDECRRIEIDDEIAADDLLTTLRAAAQSRESLVLSLADGVVPEDPPDVSDRREPHVAGVAHTFPADELDHLVWSNSIDDADAARAALGARRPCGRARCIRDRSHRHGDVTTPDGRAVWLDGGPVRYPAPQDGLEVVHAVQIEHGASRRRRRTTSGAELAPDQLAAVTHDGGAAADHRAGWFGQDPCPHRAGPPPAHELERPGHRR